MPIYHASIIGDPIEADADEAPTVGALGIPGAVGITGDTTGNDEACALAGIEAASLKVQG